MSARHPEEYIHGSVVVLPLATVIWLEQHVDMRALRATARDEPAVYPSLAALRLAYLRSQDAGQVPRLEREAAPTSEPAQDLTQWLTTREVAERLDIGPRAVIKRLGSGQLQGRQINGMWFVDPDSIAS